MRAGDHLITAADLVLAASWWEDWRNEITAVATVLGAIVIARVVDRAIVKRGGRVRAAVIGDGDLSPEVSTRLRVVRRLVTAGIVVIGVMLAFTQFPALQRLATGVLASSAVLGLVIGFAARAPIANAVAGVLIAITQPIRIGDMVTFEEETGIVEDMRLSYTYVRTADGRRIVIPNERLAQSTVENHTIIDPRVRVEASVWIPPEADAARALELLGEEEELEVSVAEVTPEGARLTAATWADSFHERGPMEAGLRARCLERLQREGLSSSES
jgi:small-conductance mechanosensitive channel